MEEQPIWVFGKTQGWFYVLDSDFHPIAQGQLIDDVLRVLPDTVTEGIAPTATVRWA